MPGSVIGPGGLSLGEESSKCMEFHHGWTTERIPSPFIMFSAERFGHCGIYLTTWAVEK
jgi:hypothetical protein